MKIRTLCAALMLVCAPAYAEDTTVALRYGEFDNYDRIGASLRFAPVWTADWGNWRAALHPELEVGRLRYDGHGPGASTLDQGGVLGMFRAVYGSGALRPYAEVGLGLALFSRTTLGGKDFSTRLQFSEHLGLGVELPHGLSAGWLYSHYSNADIKLPNDGVDFHQIVIGARF